LAMKIALDPFCILGTLQRFNTNAGSFGQLLLRHSDGFAKATRRSSWYNLFMTIEQLANVHHARPFRPYTIHMGDGPAFFVKHPDFLSRSASGRTVIVHLDDESFSVLDLLLVTELQVHAPTTADGAAA